MSVLSDVTFVCFRFISLSLCLLLLLCVLSSLLHTIFCLYGTDDHLAVRDAEKMWTEMTWYDHRIIRKALSQAFGIIGKEHTQDDTEQHKTGLE